MMKKKFLIFFFVCFFFLGSSFLLIKQFLNRSLVNEKTENLNSDPKKDNQNNSNKNNSREEFKSDEEEFKSNEIFGNSYLFEIFIFFLVPVIDFLIVVIDAKFDTDRCKEDVENKFRWSFISYYFIFLVIAEIIIFFFRYVKSKNSFFTFFKNSLKRRLRVITLVFLFPYLVFSVLLFWIGYVIVF